MEQFNIILLDDGFLTRDLVKQKNWVRLCLTEEPRAWSVTIMHERGAWSVSIMLWNSNNNWYGILHLAR